MAKKRIHQIAKELDVASADVLFQAKELGLEVKTASSGLTEEEEELVKLAFQHFQRATKHAPSHAMAWHNCGLSLLMLNNATVSLTYFENAIKLEPNVQMVLNNYGIALQKAGKTMEATIAFKRAEDIEKLLLDEKKVKRPGFDQ